MGGCYDTWDSVSSCRIRTPNWKQDMRQFLKKGKHKKLIEAYKAYSAESDFGFIGQLAALAGIEDVADIPNEFLEWEYEIKFDLEKDITGINIQM